MKRSPSTHNPYEIGGCEAADRLLKREEVSCHESCHEITSDIRHLESVSREASNDTLRCNVAAEILRESEGLRLSRF
jgi:hypothetical protein